MSTPVSSDGHSDVNDVLSSIRKLVSEEARARVEAAQADVLKPAAASASVDPLRLTPSQEIDEAAQPLVLSEVAATPEPDKAAFPTTNTGSDAAPFQDELALRQLVGEIIREELQGELGERITRNVRKLIRHEIDTALKTQS